MNHGKSETPFEDKIQDSSNPLLKYIKNNSLRLTSVQQELIQKTYELGRASIMLGALEEVQMFQVLLKSMRAKKVLEIGTFTGYTAMSMAMAMEDDGKVYTLDISPKFVDVGRDCWHKSRTEDKIVSIIKPAIEYIDELCKQPEELGTFDFIFIDADKQNYEKYYEASLILIRPGGIIAVDNTFAFGMIMMDEDKLPETIKSEVLAIKRLNKKLQSDERVDMAQLNVGDGTTLVTRKNNK
ncbi:hypothetical protein SNEBB_002055 [Seison nebaliae]|nr:hypothetical protein SNEBB_002055 [Seison nebaliae]